MSPDDSIHHVQDAIAPLLDGAVIGDLLPFANLSDQDLDAILSKATLRQILPNDTCFSQGDTARNFYVLLNGVLRVAQSTTEGEQVVILHIGPGQRFGIAKAFDNDTYNATAKAAAGGLALAWPSELWDEFEQTYPGFKTATRKAVGTRMEEMQKKIVDMATLQVEQRIAHAILRLLEQVGNETDNGIEINFPITRQDLSEMTGTTLHSVSRYLSKWQKNGIIESTRRRIVVHRPQDLPV